jgi:DNA topoisomerase IB
LLLFATFVILIKNKILKKQIKNKGGFFIKGKYHSEGGIPLVVKDTGQAIEVEKDEALIPNEALDNTKIKKRKGTNKEILHNINKEVGAKGMDENADTVESGDAIVCRRSIYDKTKRTYIGTDKQTVSAINQSGGCKVIEKGGKAIEPDGSTTQYQKGGGVSEINARWDKKKKQIEELANNIRSLNININKILRDDNCSEKDSLTALVIAILLNTSERIGNEDSADNGHYGVTGFKKKHIKIDGNTIYLKYVGKSGVEHEKSFSDKLIAKALKKAIKNSPNNYVFCTSDGFRIKADRVNRYLDEYNISAKSIRGYNANNLISQKLKKVEIPDTETKRKTLFNKVARQVAEKIGHGVPTLKKHYMMPELADNYIFDAEIVDVKEATVFATGGQLGNQSLEKRVLNRLDEQKTIRVKDLVDILGREPKYPNEYIGELKLQKCFLLPFYRLV